MLCQSTFLGRLTVSKGLFSEKLIHAGLVAALLAHSSRSRSHARGSHRGKCFGVVNHSVGVGDITVFQFDR